MRKDSKLLRKTFTYDGKRYEVYGKNNAELDLKKATLIGKLQHNEVIVESSMPVKKWSLMVAENYKENSLTPKAYKNYVYLINHFINEEIGNMPLCKVKEAHCKKCLNKMQGKANSTISYVYQIMTFIFQKAVDNGLINRNPVTKDCKPKGKVYKPRRAFTPYEEEMFLRAVEKHNHKLLFLLMYGCGCRPSEARNVEYRDFFKRNGNMYLHIRGTKTDNADRNVPVPDYIESILPKTTQPFQKVCLNKDGQPISERCLKRAWNMLERLMNIEMGCKVYRNELIPPYPLATDLCPYCLRHTYCTNLKKHGVDIVTAKYLMGHSDIRITANIYTDIHLESIDDMYDVIINGKKENEKESENESEHGNKIYLSV